MRRSLVAVLLFVLLAPLSSTAQARDYRLGDTVVVTVSAKPLRMEPTVYSTAVTTIVEGDLLRIIDGTSVQADELTWWHVRTIETNLDGWLADTVFTLSTETPDPEPSCWTDTQLSFEGGIPTWTNPPTMQIDPQRTYVATMATTMGTIILQLDAAKAPIATINFVCLANAGYYDGTEFHRIANDFLIQGGDASGTGTGNAGYTVPSDPTTGDYPEGAIALANAKPDENGSQFFIAATDLTGLIPDDYPVFGHVVAGQDVVAAISRGPVEFNPRGEMSRPIAPTGILSVEISAQDDEVGPPLPTPSLPEPPPIPTVAIAPTVALPPTTPKVIELDAKDIAFDPTELTIDAADLPVTIRMSNTGAALHNFSIEALDISVDAQPGETVDIVIPAGTAPDTYDFYCNVPGHKEAGMVGKLTVEGSANTSTSTQAVSPTELAGSCAGFPEYQRAYEDALLTALFAHPDASDILVDWDEDGSDFANLTSYEISLLAGLFSDFVVELERITPPPIAAEWHQLEVEKMRLLTNLLIDASTLGPIVAALSYSDEVDRLDAEVERALSRASACSQFVTWARDA